MDYTNRDYEGFRTAMITELESRLPEYTDTSSSDAGIVILEVLAWSLDILSYYVDVLANEMFMETAKERESVIEHTRKLGYTMLNSTPAQFYQLFEITVQGSDFTIPAGFRIKTKESSTEESIYFETDADLVISAGDTGLEQTVGVIYDYPVSVTHGYTIATDILGTSDGLADQEFNLNNTPVIAESVEVSIDEGSGFVTWTEVDNFIDSTTTSLHYILLAKDNDQFSIKFGNGTSGKIPAIVVNGISAEYRLGGGIIANVGPDTIIELDETLSGVVSTTNPEVAYVLGTEKEDIETAKINATAYVQTLGRAVTLADFENLTILEFSARQAKALYVSGVVELTVLPESSSILTAGEITTIADYFEDVKTLGTVVSVDYPVYNVINITMTATLLADYSTFAVAKKAEIEALVTSLMAIGEFTFGSPFVPAYIASQVLSTVEGLQSVYISSPSGDTVINADELFALGSLSVTVS